jgi:hypothetical protein
VAANYFITLGIPIRLGRDISRRASRVDAIAALRQA